MGGGGEGGGARWKMGDGGERAGDGCKVGVGGEGGGARWKMGDGGERAGDGCKVGVGGEMGEGGESGS